jgi:hypothetical protein
MKHNPDNVPATIHKHNQHYPRPIAPPLARLLWLALLALLLIACGVPVETEQQNLEAGGQTPQAVATSFFNDLNQALQDPQIIEPETRDTWAARLSSYFAPSERMNQRTAIAYMLNTFADGQRQLEPNHTLTIEILFSSIELVEERGDHATVHIVDGWLRLREVQITPNGRQNVIRDQRRALLDVLGYHRDELPVLRVNNRWFMTEWPGLP